MLLGSSAFSIVGGKYGSTDFCNVNLVPYGDTPYMYPILQYGGLPLPFRRTEREVYHPYPFSPEHVSDFLLVLFISELFSSLST